MKILLLLISFTSIMTCSAQVNRYFEPLESAKYEPNSYEDMSNPLLVMQRRYDHNQKYLYSLKKWILHLNPQIKEENFKVRLDKQYKNLTAIENGDLARETRFLNQTENAILEIISEYNIWLEDQKTKLEENKKNVNVSSYAQLGIKYYNDGNFVLAIRSFSQHLENDANNTDVLFYRALAKSEMKDYYGAISDYDKILNLVSDYPLLLTKVSMIYNNKAYSYVLLKQYDKALPLVNTALKMDDSEWFYWDTRGEIYLNLGDYEKSILDLNKSLSIYESESSYFLRGIAYIKLGQNENGCKDLSKAGELGNIDAYSEINKYCN